MQEPAAQPPVEACGRNHRVWAAPDAKTYYQVIDGNERNQLIATFNPAKWDETVFIVKAFTTI